MLINVPKVIFRILYCKIDIGRSNSSSRPRPVFHSKENECSKYLVAYPYEDPTNLHMDIGYTYQPIR